MRIRDTIIGTLLGASLSWLMLSKQFGTWGYQNKEYWAIAFGVLLFLPFSWWFSPYIRTQSEKRMISPYGAVVSIFLVLIWLVPLNCTGITKANLYTIPAPIRNQYRISCLFTYASRSWHTVHYEVRKEGQVQWEEGPLKGFFELDIFGYRTKLNRVGLASRHKGKDGKIHGKNKIRFIDMAEFIATRWAENYPTDLKVKEVRFYRVAHKVGKEHCMKREVWSRPILSSIPEEKRELLVLISLKKEADKKKKYAPRFNVNDRAKPLPKVKP